MKKAPEQYRVKKGSVLASDESYGNNGFFVIPHPKIFSYFLNCQISDGMGWEHVSITLTQHLTLHGSKTKVLPVKRCPTWEDMCYVKDIFWNEDECVIQYHPPKSQYVSCHPYCLHLWKPTMLAIPVPESILVGPDSAIKGKGEGVTLIEKL